MMMMIFLLCANLQQLKKYHLNHQVDLINRFKMDSFFETWLQRKKNRKVKALLNVQNT